jgi:hypothetical protein
MHTYMDFLFIYARLPEPCPLDADVGDLSAHRVPSTQQMCLFRRRAQPTVRHDLHRT